MLAFGGKLCISGAEDSGHVYPIRSHRTLRPVGCHRHLGLDFLVDEGGHRHGVAQLGAAMPLVVGLFMTVRFGMAALLMPLVIPAARRGARQAGVMRDGGLIAAILYAGFLLQMFGLEGVDPAVSAFLTSLYVGFVALFTSILDKKPLGMVAVVGVLMVTIGAAFISGPPQLSFDTPEWLTVPVPCSSQRTSWRRTR